MTQMRNRSGGGGSGGGDSSLSGGGFRGGGVAKAFGHSPVATVAISVDSWIIAVQPRWATAVTSFGHAVGTSRRRSGGWCGGGSSRSGDWGSSRSGGWSGNGHYGRSHEGVPAGERPVS